LLALTTTGRAELMAERSQLVQARQELERAERWASDAGDEVGRAEVERVRALVAYKEGDLDGALAAAEFALATARTYDSAVLAAECAALLALTLKRLGRAADAEERRAEALDGLKRLGADRLRERFEEEWGAASATRRRAE
jgi:tetratricopeptide (TPR) repeat protein